MINIDKNYQIKIQKPGQKKLITLKIYKKSNGLNGSWKWLNNEKVTSLMDKGFKKITLKDQLNYLYKINKSKKDILFAIYFKNNHIGNVGLHKINFKNKTAQFGIIIGNTNYHNKGIGKLVWYEIMSFGFNNLMLNKIYTMIAIKNIASTKIARLLGFKKMSKKFFIFKKRKKLDYPKYFLSKKLFQKKV